MSAARRRLVGFAGSAVEIESQGERAAALVEFLYRHVPVESDTSPCAVYRLVSDDVSGEMRLYRGDVLFGQGASEAAVGETLLGDSGHRLAAQSRGGLLFHAAGLACRGRGILLPGGIGAGKTTLTVWLVTTLGLDYLTDEMVFVPCGTETMQPFTRPLNLKAPARAVLKDVVDFEKGGASILRGAYSDLISPLLLNPADIVREPGLDVIIFPRYLPEAPAEFCPLSKAQAGLTLMECLVNARNLPDHGFPEVVRLARAVPAYRMHYADFGQVAGQVGSLLGL